MLEVREAAIGISAGLEDLQAAGQWHPLNYMSSETPSKHEHPAYISCCRDRRSLRWDELMDEIVRPRPFSPEEYADVLAVFEAADRASEKRLPIALMADRLFAAFDAGERDPILLKAAVLDRPPEVVELRTFAAKRSSRS